MNDDSVDAMLAAHAQLTVPWPKVNTGQGSKIASAILNGYSTNPIPMDTASEQAWSKMQEDVLLRRAEENRQAAKLEEFRKSYIKIRTDNIVLDHQCAIELTKMIFSEADTLTYKDTL